jgi:hypothetical protein
MTTTTHIDSLDPQADWLDWHWDAYFHFRSHQGPEPLTAEQLLKKTGPRRYGITLPNVVDFLPTIRAKAEASNHQQARQAQEKQAADAAARITCPPLPAWRLIDSTPMPAAAALAVALLGRKRRRKPMPLGRDFAAATNWDTPSGRAPGICFQELPEPEQGPSGTWISTMGARFTVLATAAGMHVHRAAPDLRPDDLAIARAAIDRVCRPETLAAYAAAEVKGCPSPSCIACGRALGDQASLSRGFGPECWARLSDAVRARAA